EIVGFWTPEYLRTKLDKVRRVGLDNLLLVVYRGLAAGVEDAAVEAEAPLGNVLWFARKPRIGAVMDAVERVAR
ncbi:MAG: DUF790 family protein, partial [Gemmatimonadota bacterium]